MLSKLLFAAFAAVVPLSCAGTVPAELQLNQRFDEIEAVANDDLILEAFIEANHPNASPNRTMLEHGDMDMYMFPEEEWQEMRTSLLEKAGIDESALMARELTVRQDEPEDPPIFFCKDANTRPVVYAAKMSAAVYGVCSLVVDGGPVGYRYLFRRNVEDARPPPQNVGFVRATISFLPKVVKWATSGACGVGLGTAVTKACVVIEENTPEGEQQVTTGFTTEDENLKASITFSG